MNLRWNPDGEGIRDIPPKLLEFARSKRRELLANCAISAALGLVLGRTLAYLYGVPGALDPTAIFGVGGFLSVSVLVLGVGLSSLF